MDKDFSEGFMHDVADLLEYCAENNTDNVDLTGIDWVIVGGESGNRARPMKEEWVMNIKDQAEVQGVAFFFKQWGTWGSDGVKRSKEANGHLLNGKMYQEIPSK